MSAILGHWLALVQIDDLLCQWESLSSPIAVFFCSWPIHQLHQLSTGKSGCRQWDRQACLSSVMWLVVGKSQAQHWSESLSLNREIGEKEFVDHPLAGVTDAALYLGCWVGGHYDTAAVAHLPHRDIGAVVELPHQATFWAAELLISWQVQTALDRLLIQHAVIFAAHDKREAC
jgi:hypothetical protein